jgi:hypothetical protein
MMTPVGITIAENRRRLHLSALARRRIVFSRPRRHPKK